MKHFFTLFCAVTALISTVTAFGKTISITLFPLPNRFGFEYVYGTWKNPLAVRGFAGGVEIAPPANDSGGGGALIASAPALPSGTIIRVTARLGAQNEADAFNIVLKDEDPEGVEDHVYRIPTSSFSTEEDRTVDVSIDQSSSINNVKNGVPDYEAKNGLRGWEIQGTFERGAPLHLIVKRIEIVTP